MATGYRPLTFYVQTEQRVVPCHLNISICMNEGNSFKNCIGVQLEPVIFHPQVKGIGNYGSLIQTCTRTSHLKQNKSRRRPSFHGRSKSTLQSRDKPKTVQCGVVLHTMSSFADTSVHNVLTLIFFPYVDPEVSHSVVECDVFQLHQVSKNPWVH